MKSMMMRFGVRCAALLWAVVALSPVILLVLLVMVPLLALSGIMLWALIGAAVF